MQLTHKENYTIRSNEIGLDGSARPDSIATLLQEIAGNHAKALEFDIEDLRNRDITWVLHKLHVRMKRYPDWRETIQITTWPSSGDRLRAYRDFNIKDQQGKELGVALSYWLLMNLKSRRPVRIPDEIIRMGLTSQDHVLPLTKEKLEWELKEADENIFTVRRTDLDINQHANNVAYIRWIMETVDEQTYTNGHCSEFTIQYNEEAGLRDKINVLTLKTGKHSHHHQLKKHGKTIARAKSLWKANDR